MSQRNISCGFVDSAFTKTPCKGQVFSLDLSSLTWYTYKELEADIFSRSYHATVYMPSSNALYIFGGERQTPGGMRETLCINSVIVMLDTVTYQYTLLKPRSSCPPKNLYGCSFSYVPFENDCFLITGGYIKSDSSPIHSGNPMSSAMLLSVHDKMVEIRDQIEIPEYSKSAGHTIVCLSRRSFVMLGGSAPQISILTDLDLDTDICPASVCVIENSTISPITWIECSLCSKWYHLICVGLESVPKADYHCNSCLKACKKKGISTRTSV